MFLHAAIDTLESSYHQRYVTNVLEEKQNIINCLNLLFRLEYVCM